MSLVSSYQMVGRGGIWLAVAALLLTGCGDVKKKPPDPEVWDAAVTEEEPVVPSAQLGTSSGRVRSDSYTLDVQIGQPMEQKQAKGASGATAEPATPVKR